MNYKKKKISSRTALLVFHCHVTNYHKLRGLKQHSLLSDSFSRSKSKQHSSGAQRTEIKVSTWAPLPDTIGWQNLVLKINVPVFLWVWARSHFHSLKLAFRSGPSRNMAVYFFRTRRRNFLWFQRAATFFKKAFELGCIHAQ